MKECHPPSEPANRTLVFVHGHGFKPAAEPLMELATAAMSAGIERDHPELSGAFAALDKRLAYYGDITGEHLASRGRVYDEALDIGDRRNTLNELRALKRRKDFGLGPYDRLPGKSALGEFAADVLGPLIGNPLIGNIGLSNRLIAEIGTDLREYWNPESDFADRVRERVRRVIATAFDEGREILLICHGTGCIVVYDVLWLLSREAGHADRYRGRKIDLWLTLGAPLGDSMASRRLLGAAAGGAERFPDNIVSWHNVSAEDDYFCHDKTLADDFSAMLDLRCLSTIRDHLIYNLAVRYGRSDPHHSLGYLIHPRVSRIVVDWMASAPVATAR